MSRKNILFIVVTLFLSAAASAATPTIEARLIQWKPTIGVEAAATSGGLAGTLIDLDEELGFDNEKKITGWEARLNLGSRHHIFGGRWNVEYGGQNTLARSINFAGKRYSILSTVETNLEIDFFQAGYQLDLIGGKDLSLGVVLDMHRYQLDAELSAMTFGGTLRATTNLEATVGLVGLALSSSAFGNTTVNLRAEGMVYGEGDELWDFRGELGWSIISNVRVIGGYRWMQIKFDDEDFVIDAKLAGPYLALQAEF